VGFSLVVARFFFPCGYQQFDLGLDVWATLDEKQNTSDQSSEHLVLGLSAILHEYSIGTKMLEWYVVYQGFDISHLQFLCKNFQ
jgi:hypothetical protein